MAFGLDDILIGMQLLSMAKGLVDAFRPPQPPPMPAPPPTLSWDEAKQRAQAVYNPLYEEQTRRVLENLDKQLIARGLYGLRPGDALALRAVADLENQKNAAIGQLANQLVGQSEEAARQQQQLAMQYAMNNWNTQLANQIARTNALMDASRSALSAWATIADVTGFLPKLPWQQGDAQPTLSSQLTSALRAMAANLRSGPVEGTGTGGLDPLAAGVMRAIRTPSLSFSNPYGG